MVKEKKEIGTLFSCRIGDRVDFKVIQKYTLATSRVIDTKENPSFTESKKYPVYRRMGHCS